MAENQHAEQDLAELWFGALASASTIGVFRADFDHGILWVNDAFVEICGAPREEIIGKPWRQGVNPDDLPRVMNVLEVSQTDPRPLQVEFRLTRPDGGVRWVRVRAAPVCSDGEGIGYTGTLEDLTDAVEIAREAARLAAACQTTSDVVAITDASGRIRYLNPAGRVLLGVDGAEGSPELTTTDLYTASSLARVQTEMLLDLVRSGRWSGEVELAGRGGSAIPVSLVATLERGAGDTVEHIVIVARDVRPERALATAASRGDARYRLLAEASPFGIVEITPRGQIAYVNQRFCDLIGLAVDEAREQVATGELIHPDDREDVISRIVEAIGDERAETLEHRLVRGDGTVLWALARITPVFAGDGHFHGYVATIEDVSEEVRERAEVDRLVGIFDATPDCASIVDADGGILFMNPAARELFGIGLDEDLADRDWRSFYAPWAIGRLEGEAAAALAERGVWVGEAAIVASDGREVPVSQTIVVSRGDDGSEWYATIARDISELKEAEARIAESEAWFRTLLQNLTDLVIVQSADGRILYMSPSVEAMLGYSPAQFLSGQLMDLSLVHPDDHEAVRAAWREARDEPGGTARSEYRVRHRDGDWRWLQTTMHNLLDDLSVRGIVTNATDITEERRARLAQAHSEAALRAIVLQSPLAIYAVDRDGTVRLWNHAAEATFGYSADEVVGRRLPMSGEGGKSRFGEIRERVMRGETVRDVELESRRKDGTPFVVSLSAAPVRDEHGEIATILGVFGDITEQRHAEAALRRSEERFRALVTHASDMILVFDRDLNVSYASPSVLAFLGHDAGSGEITTARLARVHSEDEKRVRDVIEEVISKGGTCAPFEARFSHRDGRWRWMEVVATNLLDDPAVQGVVMNARDVTERVEAAAALQQTNEALRSSNEALAAVFENSPMAIYTLDVDGIVLSWNPAAEAIFGFSADEAVGRFSPVVRDVDLAEAHATRRRVMSGEVVQPTEARRRHKDGHEIEVMFTVAPMRDRDGDVDAVLILSTDITATKGQERSLRESEERFRVLAEHASVIITILEADGTVRYTSPSAVRILGYPEGYGEGENVFSYVHPEDRDRVAELFEKQTLELGATETVMLRLPNAAGEWRTIEAVADNLLGDPAVRGILVTGRDVTEQVEAERAARSSEERFRALVQNLTDIVTIVDEHGIVRWTAPAVERVLGYGVDELIGSSAREFVHPDDRETLVRMLDDQLAHPGRKEPVTFRVRHKDGSWRHLEAVLDDLRDNPAIGGLVITSRDATESLEAEARLAESEARYRGIVEDQTELICRYDRSGTLTFVNEAFARHFGQRVEEIVGTVHTPFIPEEDLKRLRRALATLGPDNPAVTVGFRMIRPEGEIRWYEWTQRAQLDAEGEITEYLALGRDITEQHEAEALVGDQARVLEMVARGAPVSEALEELCRIVESQSPDVVCSALLVDEANPGYLRFGAAPSVPDTMASQLDGVPIGPRAGSCGTAAHLGEPVVVTNVETDPLWSDHRQLPLAHGLRAAWSYPITIAPSGQVVGTFCLYSREARPPSRRHEQLVEMVVHHAAIAIERKQFEAQLAHQAHHDPLTGLPNRVLFLEFLVLSLARARRYRSTVAVLFLDLDRFKVINDSLGHDTGDEVLVALGERLRSVLRPGDTVARFGGDEFTILCEDLSGPLAKHQAVEVAERLLDAIRQPFMLDGEEHFLSASVGIALAMSGDDRPDALLRDADAAMYRAKERGKGRWEVFDDSMRLTALRRLEIESALHRAIDRGEFRVFYQPCMSITDGRCVGAEALVRWQHPERGLVAPLEFIGLAEETGLVVPLGRWVLEEACRQVSRWVAERSGQGSFQVSVNLSGRQLVHPELVDHVAAAIDRTAVDPGLICLEITESVLMEDIEATIGTLHRLKELGVRLSIDDFGTGYSSLGFLKRFPVDFVKVDQSFVSGLGTDPDDSAIVAAVISLGHALGIQVVAEGVETELQLSELQRLGCDQAQGYLFAPPQPPRDAHGFMTRSTWRRSTLRGSGS